MRISFLGGIMGCPYEHCLADLGFKPDTGIARFSPLGKTHSVSNEHLEGFYWFYETENFSINIHDFFVKEDVVISHGKNEGKHVRPLNIVLIKHACGELIKPYATLENDTIFAINQEGNSFRFLLHGGFPLLAIGIEYSESYWQKQLAVEIGQSRDTIDRAIQAVNNTTFTTKIGEIVSELFVCRDENIANAAFFEAKVEDLIKIIVKEHFEGIEKKKKMPAEDDEALEAVKKYIDDHYAADLPQELLCRIAFMGRTKLKAAFKEKFGMTITEYIQRKRINVAEHLLISSDLNIADVANSIGYKSHSRFSELFKKYKGVGPKEFQLMLRK